jgi:hypothetical protein
MRLSRQICPTEAVRRSTGGLLLSVAVLDGWRQGGAYTVRIHSKNT